MAESSIRSGRSNVENLQVLWENDKWRFADQGVGNGEFCQTICCNAWTGFSVDGYELDSQEICWAGFYVESAFVGKILSGCLVGECWKLDIQSLNLRNACSD